MGENKDLSTKAFPKTAYLYPTLLCNLHCKMCYSGGHQNVQSLKNELTLDEYKKLISDLYECGVRKFDISGGEPLLRDDTTEILKEIKSYDDTQLFVVSNGTLLKDCLDNLKPVLSGIDRLYISFDSTIEDEHNAIRGDKNAYAKSIEGLTEIQKAGFENIGVNFLIMQDNCTQIENILQFALEHNLRYINLLRLLDVSVNGAMFEENLNIDSFIDIYTNVIEWIEKNNCRAKKPLDITLVLPGFCMQPLMPYKKRFDENYNIKISVEFDPLMSCMAFKNSVVITSEGKFTGCTAMYSMEEFIAGDLRQSSVAEILGNWESRSAVMKEREDIIKAQQPCSECEYWRTCRGGCPAVAYKYYGTIMKSDPTCIKMQKENK